MSLELGSLSRSALLCCTSGTSTEFGCHEFVCACVPDTPHVQPVDYCTTVVRPQCDDWLQCSTIFRLSWDCSAELQASMPVVLRISAQDYRMWTYGRELNFSQYKDSAFGRSGYFTSMDGLHWTSVSGMHITWLDWQWVQ